MPTASSITALEALFSDNLLFQFPKSSGEIQRDFKWLGSYRYGILHLGGRDPADLRRRCEHASSLLGWTAPYIDYATDLPGFGQGGDAWPAGISTESVSG